MFSKHLKSKHERNEVLVSVPLLLMFLLHQAQKEQTQR